MARERPLEVYFYQSSAGNEPVREWLKQLPKPVKKAIGEDIKTVQYGWPLGMPVVKKLESGIWETRTNIPNATARVLFTVVDSKIILLHGFIKKTKKTPLDDLNLARARCKEINKERKNEK